MRRPTTGREGPPRTLLATAPPVAGDGVPQRASGLERLWRAWRTNATFQRIVTWGLLLVLWQAFALAAGPFFFPTLPRVLAGLGEVFTDGTLLTLAGSFRQMFVGFGLAVAVGVPIGLLIGSSHIADWTLGFYVNALFVTSLSALLPFLILIFGVGLPFRASVVFLFAVFYLIINPAAGVRSIPKDLKEMEAAFTASRLKRFISLMVPGTLPYILAGMRLGLGQSVQGMIIAELWVSVDTGRLLTALGLQRELGEFFALTLVIVIAGALMTHALLVLQRRLAPWAQDAQVGIGRS